LRKYAEDNIQKKDKNQQGMHFEAGYKLDTIYLAVTPQRYYDYIEKTLNEARTNFASGIPLNLINAAIAMSRFRRENPGNQEAKNVAEDISKKLCEYKSCATKWLFKNKVKDEWKPLIPHITRLQRLIGKLDFNEIDPIGDTDKSLLEELCRASLGKIIDQDLRLPETNFIDDCKENLSSLSPGVARAAL
jgi:hypothetical protein